LHIDIFEPRMFHDMLHLLQP
jgi:hypothetical protein